MIASYHNHSRWSDGKTDLETIVQHAATLGLDEVGVSDHFTLDPSGRSRSWSLPIAEFDAYVAELTALRDRTNSPVVRIGVEVDWFDGMTDTLKARLAPHPFDYVIGSVHEIGAFTVDGSPAGWTKLHRGERNEVHRRYWQEVVRMAESGLFDIAAHLDLCKKFGDQPTIDLSKEIGDALDAIAAADLVVEINTAGWHKPCGDAYPSEEIVAACACRGIAMTVNADAHHPSHLLRDFDRALDRLAAAGYTEVIRFAGRERSSCSIDAARPHRGD